MTKCCQTNLVRFRGPPFAIYFSLETPPVLASFVVFIKTFANRQQPTTPTPTERFTDDGNVCREPAPSSSRYFSASELGHQAPARDNYLIIFRRIKGTVRPASRDATVCLRRLTSLPAACQNRSAQLQSRVPTTAPLVTSLRGPA